MGFPRVLLSGAELFSGSFDSESRATGGLIGLDRQYSHSRAGGGGGLVGGTLHLEKLISTPINTSVGWSIS